MRIFKDFCALFHAEIPGVPIDAVVIRSDQCVRLHDVMHVGCCPCDCMNVACCRIRTGMNLHAEGPLIPFPDGVHFRLAGLRGVLGRAWCMDDGGVNDCTAVHDESCGVQPLFHVIEHLAGDVMLFQQVSKVQECRSIRCPFDGEVDLQEALHALLFCYGLRIPCL